MSGRRMSCRRTSRPSKHHHPAPAVPHARGWRERGVREGPSAAPARDWYVKAAALGNTDTIEAWRALG